MTGPKGNSEFKIHCFPKNKSLSDLLYSFLRRGKKTQFEKRAKHSR